MTANSVTFGDRTYTLDAHGFLDPPDQWDEAFANGMARMVGVFEGLTEEHWSFLNYLRRKFLDEQSVPMVVFACADNKLKLGRLKVLFPTGYHRGACRIAGINYEFMYQHNIWLTYENYKTLLSEYHLTGAGFLEEFDDWDEKFASTIAQEWNLPAGLSEAHWKVLRYLRDYYRINEGLPAVFETCRANDISLEDLRTLFPEGYRRGACRAAGLPFFG